MRKSKDESSVLTQTLYSTISKSSVDVLPPYDKANRTKNACIVAIVCIYMLSIACTGYGIYVVRIQARAEVLDPPPYLDISEITKLLLCTIAAFIMDILGYIHSVSLRWSLWHEGRLKFNSNVRLFTSSKDTFANSRCANISVSLSLIFAYAALSCIISNDPDYAETFTPSLFNGISILILGLCILLQTAIAHLCFKKHSKRILSWSSDPLNTTLVCVHYGLKYHDGYSLVPAHQDASYADGAYVTASKRQPSILRTDKSVRHILRLIWVLSIVCAVWGAVLVFVIHKLNCEYSTIKNYGCEPPFFLQISGVLVSSIPPLSELKVWLILVVFQALATLVIHCAEVIVNRSRDEQRWRMAHTSRTGVTLGWSSCLQACISWKTIVLFICKPFIHWIYGQSISYFSINDMGIDCRFIFALSGAFIALAIFATAITGNRPKGYQPSAYGHLQTLANLIDDWGGASGNQGVLFWGDKGLNPDGTRHAGTSNRTADVGEMVPNAFYL